MKLNHNTVLAIMIRPPNATMNAAVPESGGSPLKDFHNVIRNLLDSSLDCKIPDFILEIPVHQN